MANSYLTVNKLAMESLPLLRESMLIAGKVNNDMDLVDEMTSVSGGGKGGGTIRVRRPVRYTVREGTSRSNQDITEQWCQVPAPMMRGVDFTIPTTALAKDIEYVSKRYLTPAVAQLASKIDTDIAANYTAIYNVVGKPGTAPDKFKYIGDIHRRMNELNVPNEGRHLAFCPAHRASMADAMKGLYSKDLTEDAVRRGELGRLSTLMTMETNNIPAHLTGDLANGALVDGAVARGARTINMDNADNGDIIRAGDWFSIANVYEINPMTRLSTGVLKQFVAKSNATLSGGHITPTTVHGDEMSEGMQFDGQYQNMSAQIAQNAQVFFLGRGGVGGVESAGASDTTYQQSLAFHRNAFWFGMFPLTDHLPGAEAKTVQDAKSGVSLRLSTQYDIDDDNVKYRLDAYYATDCLCPELAVRLVG